MSDADTLERAATILRGREEARKAEVRWLYQLYARKRACEPHQLGKPRKLSHDEVLLLVALEQHGYDAYAECPNHNRWHGDATCKRHTRGSAVVVMAASRLDLLWVLWVSVSHQDQDAVTLTEAHLTC